MSNNPEAPVSSIEGAGATPPDSEPAPSTIIPSSQDSASSQSGSDKQNPAAKVDKDAKAALHQIEVAMGIQIAHKYRGAMIDQSLALGGRDALESFRQACSCWREDYKSKASQGLLVAPTQEGDVWHPALDRFSRAYHTAKNTTLRRATLDILHRVDLSHLYDTYVETLKALTHPSHQSKASISNTSSRAQDRFGSNICDIAKDQMFWACYPDHRGKPRSSITGLDRTFRNQLAHAEKWYTLQKEFSIGFLALIPPGGNTWFEKLPLKDLPVYFYLIHSVNPMAVSMGEMVSSRVSASWKGEDQPVQLLRLEHLETIDEIPFRANPLRLLEEIDVGCVPSYSQLPAGVQGGRAVTVPAGVDENNIHALDSMFLSGTYVSGVRTDYSLLPGFYHNVEFLGAL
jgi:hypothetical protein